MNKEQIDKIKKIYTEIENKLYDYMRDNHISQIIIKDEYDKMIKYKGVVEALNLVLRLLHEGDDKNEQNNN